MMLVVLPLVNVILVFNINHFILCLIFFDSELQLVYWFVFIGLCTFFELFLKYIM